MLVSGLLFRGGPLGRVLQAVAAGQLALVLPDPARGERRHMLPLGHHEGIPLMTQALLAQLRRG